MKSLHSIVYVSTASWNLTTADLEALLVELRARNEANGITGLLLYNNGTFMQCLEGTRTAVDAAYARIRGSKRHGDIVELLNEAITRRRFADWQMAFAHPSGAELDALRATSRWKHSRDVTTGRTIPDSLGLFLLQEFWGRMRLADPESAPMAVRAAEQPALRTIADARSSPDGRGAAEDETDLRCIGYLSAATQPMTADDLEELLIDAREFNAEHGITGLLAYRDGIFMQCFEGTSAAVEKTYDRIRRSSKHRGIVELLNSPMVRRSFSGWHMAFARPTESELKALTQASWYRATQEISVRWSDTAGLALLRAFWLGLWRERHPPPSAGHVPAG